MFEPFTLRNQNLKKPMSQHRKQHKVLDSSRHWIDSCTFQLHSWRPFKFQPPTPSDSNNNPIPYSSTTSFHTKRPCLSDRATSFSVDMSRLSLFDDDKPFAPAPLKRVSSRLIARKRRRRGSRSASGMRSDQSSTRRCCSVGASAAYGTCSDLPMAVGTDSSGELFGNGDTNWASDVSEAKNSRRDREGGGEKENGGGGFGHNRSADAQGNESGYGSEPGYRGDVELGYGDEFDEEEDDSRVMFWGDQFGGAMSKMEIVGENTFSEQKGHYRYRRKKNDCRMVD